MWAFGGACKDKQTSSKGFPGSLVLEGVHVIWQRSEVSTYHLAFGLLGSTSSAVSVKRLMELGSLGYAEQGQEQEGHDALRGIRATSNKLSLHLMHMSLFLCRSLSLSLSVLCICVHAHIEQT